MTLGFDSDAETVLLKGEKERPNNALLLTTHAQLLLEYVPLCCLRRL